MMFGDHWMYGGFIWIFWILVIIGLIFLFKWMFQQSKPGETKDNETPLDTLKKRYAKGEINKEEFEQKRKDLLGS